MRPELDLLDYRSEQLPGERWPLSSAVGVGASEAERHKRCKHEDDREVKKSGEPQPTDPRPLLLRQRTVGTRRARRHKNWVPRIGSDSFADRLSPLRTSRQSHPGSLTPPAPRRQVSRRDSGSAGIDRVGYNCGGPGMPATVDSFFHEYARRYTERDVDGVTDLCLWPFLAIRKEEAIHLPERGARSRSKLAKSASPPSSPLCTGMRSTRTSRRSRPFAARVWRPRARSSWVSS